MKTGHLDIRVEPALIDAIDQWRQRQPVPPSRAATVSHILERWFAANTAPAPEPNDQRPLLAPRRLIAAETNRS